MLSKDFLTSSDFIITLYYIDRVPISAVAPHKTCFSNLSTYWQCCPRCACAMCDVPSISEISFDCDAASLKALPPISIHY
jgi:hypothetical protein